MRRVILIVALAAFAAAPSAASAASAANVPRPVQASLTAAPPAPLFASLGSRIRFGSRSRGFGYGYGYRGRPRHSFLRRVVKTAIWLYVLHLFFSHGGLSLLLWIVIIGLVVSMMRRRRRRRYYAYGGR